MEEEEMYRILDEKIDALKIKDKSVEDRKTYDQVFDRDTLHVLYKLITSKVIGTLDYPISTGKEGNVFRATDRSGELLAVKIYRTSTSTYKNLTKYIIGDTRFRNVPKDRNGIIYLWAQKEYKNLARMFNSGIQAPEPKKQLKNVLVMKYIGDEQQPAPMLKDISLKNPRRSFDTILSMMRELYLNVKLVHGDLSEYNILVHEEEPFLIDVGQSVVLEHPLAQELLIRDIANMSRYFNKLGIEAEQNKMLKFIMGE